MKIETWFDKQGEKIVWNKRDDYLKLIKSLPDGRYINIVEKVQNKRSLDQNNAMWGIPYLFMKRALIESGQFKDPSNQQIHEFCMHYCLPEDYKERIKKEYDAIEPLKDLKTGELFKTAFRLTTTKMTTIDSMNYYSNMQMFYIEYFASGNEDDFIPDPDSSLKRRNNKSKIVDNFNKKSESQEQ